MYDPTFHTSTLENELRFTDFLKHHDLFDPVLRGDLILRSESRARTGFAGVALRKSSLRGDFLHQFALLEDELVARKIARNIKRITKVRQSNRNIIVNRIERLCGDGLALRIYKIDIKSFYESVAAPAIIDALGEDIAFSQTSVRLLQSLFLEFNNAGITGLPRGMALSATLSEYLMRPFDQRAWRLEEVVFYSRFVDDMIFITHGTEDPSLFMKNIREALPSGLTLNAKKSKYFDLQKYAKTNKDTLEKSFDFLGYAFHINYAVRNKENMIERKVRVDISDSKVSKIKTRIVKAAIDYISTGNFGILDSRIKLLTSNYKFLDIDKKSFRRAGIYFNYEKTHGNLSTSLIELDTFLKRFFLSKNGRLGAKLNISLTSPQKKALLRHSFREGFTHKTFFSFSGSQLAELQRCWQYA